MKKYIFSEELGNIDERFIKEVLEYSKLSRSGRRQKMKVITKITAIAACAAMIIGAGALWIVNRGAEIPVKPDVSAPEPVITDAPAPEPVITDEPAPEPEQSDDIVVVEHSYNERIENGEEVRIETYIGRRIEHQGFAYTLKDITISPTFPEGITKDDIRHTPSVIAYTDDNTGEFPEGFTEKSYDYDTYAAEHGLPLIDQEWAKKHFSFEGKFSRALNVGDVIDDNGLYHGPMDVPDEGYRWMFLELEIENLTDEEQIEYMADMEICGGVYLDHPLIHFIDERGLENEYYSDFKGYSYFGNTVCYMSEHTDKEIYDGEADVKKFHNLDFEPNETKSLILGYCVSDHFVYGELFLTLHNSEFTYMDDFVYLPLK